MKCKSLRMLHRMAGIAGSLLVFGLTSLADTGLEFSVTGPNVVVTKDEKELTRPPQVGDSLYISCSFIAKGDPYPMSPYSPVLFVIQVDGKTIDKVAVAVTANKPTPVGVFWTATSAGAHTVSCEVNGDKGYQEANYSDNRTQTTVMVAQATRLLSPHDQPSNPAERAQTEVRLPPGPLTSKAPPGQGNLSTTGKLMVPATDLVIDQVHATVNPECSKFVAVVAVDITVRNAGTLAVPANTGSLVEVKPDSPLVGSGWPLPALASGQTADITLHLRTSSIPTALTGKTFGLDASINANKKVQESNYANNSGHTSVTFPANYCK